MRCQRAPPKWSRGPDEDYWFSFEFSLIAEEDEEHLCAATGESDFTETKR